MIKKRLFLTLIAALALLTGCVRTSPAITSTPEPTQPATNNSPTSTPTHLSPLYKLHIFVGGHGWASNVDQTIFYNTRNFGEHWLQLPPPVWLLRDLAGELLHHSQMVTSVGFAGQKQNLRLRFTLLLTVGVNGRPPILIFRVDKSL